MENANSGNRQSTPYDDLVRWGNNNKNTRGGMVLVGVIILTGTIYLAFTDFFAGGASHGLLLCILVIASAALFFPTLAMYCHGESFTIPQESFEDRVARAAEANRPRDPNQPSVASPMIPRTPVPDTSTNEPSVVSPIISPIPRASPSAPPPAVVYPTAPVLPMPQFHNPWDDPPPSYAEVCPDGYAPTYPMHQEQHHSAGYYASPHGQRSPYDPPPSLSPAPVSGRASPYGAPLAGRESPTL